MTAFQEQYPIPSSQVNTIPSDLLRRLGRGRGKGVVNDPEKCNWTNYWHGTHCNKKGTITTAQPKRGPCHGPGHFQPLWQPWWSPACGFFITLIHCPTIWSPPTGHCCWLWTHRALICSVSMWPHILPMTLAWFWNDWAHSSMEISFSPSVSRSWLI